MSLVKVIYTDDQTYINADNMNDIQDAIVENEDDIDALETVSAAAKGINFGVSSSAAATVNKSATVTEPFELATGALIAVKFSYANYATNPTLNVNNTGAKAIKRRGSIAIGNTSPLSWSVGQVVLLIYDGTYWLQVSAPDIGLATVATPGLMSAADKNRMGLLDVTGLTDQDMEQLVGLCTALVSIGQAPLADWIISTNDLLEDLPYKVNESEKITHAQIAALWE